MFAHNCRSDGKVFASSVKTAPVTMNHVKEVKPLLQVIPRQVCVCILHLIISLEAWRVGWNCGI